MGPPVVLTRVATDRQSGRPPPARGRAVALVVLAVFAITVWAAPRLQAAPVRSMACLALLAFALALALVRRLSRTGWLSVPAIYLYVFAAFHLGIAPLLALGLDLPDFGSASAVEWARNRPVGPALLAVAMSTLSYSLGAWAGTHLPQPRRRSRPNMAPARTERIAERRVAALAFLVSATGVFGWFAFVISRGGFSLLTGSYLDYLAVAGGAALSLIYLALGLAGALAAVAPSHRYSRAAIALLVLFALVALPLGLRGEVLFPLAGALAVLAKHRRIQTRPFRWLLVVLVLLGGIAFVRSVRSTGLTETRGGIDVNPVHGLAELGYSLRPVAEAVDWQLRLDEPARGRTYTRPFERALGRLVPVSDLPPASEDPYIMSTLVVQRVGPIGFSPVAEGVVNFGIFGAAGYMAIVGILLGWLDRRTSRVSMLVLVGVILVPFLIQTRNAFVGVPAQLAFGLVVWVCVLRPPAQRPTRAAAAQRPHPSAASKAEPT